MTCPFCHKPDCTTCSENPAEPDCDVTECEKCHQVVDIGDLDKKGICLDCQAAEADWVYEQGRGG